MQENESAHTLISSVLVQPEEYARPDIEDLARARSAHLTHGTAHPGYALDSNRLGVVGELATGTCLRQLAPADWDLLWIADRSDSLADIALVLPGGRRVTIEVKTFSPGQWRTHGRVIHSEQASNTDASLYIWCVAPRWRRPGVHVLGWSSIHEVQTQRKPAEYTGSRDDRPRRPEPIWQPAPEPLPIQYGLDDYDVDEYEVHGYGWYDQPGTEPTDDEFDSAPEGVVVEWTPSQDEASGPDDWTEGDQPRQGFGPSAPNSKILAPIHPMYELVAWIQDHPPTAAD
jgi:hypothetical protein